MSEHEASVTLTDAAIRKVLEFIERNEGASGECLRLSVRGGGCSGFEYVFDLDGQKDDDIVSTHTCDEGEVTVIIDPFSLPFLEGSAVDYVDDFSGAGFRLSNPNASGSCGCGESFSM